MGIHFFIRNSNIFHQGDTFDNVFYTMSVILFKPHSDNVTIGIDSQPAYRTALCAVEL